MTQIEKRREYRRVWTMLKRAAGNDLDVDLALAVHIYGRHIGLSFAEASDVCYEAARAGLFGYISQKTK